MTRFTILLVSLAWLAAAPLRAAQPLDPCRPPYGEITHCPQKYYPKPHPPRNPNDKAAIRYAMRLAQDAVKAENVEKENLSDAIELLEQSGTRAAFEELRIKIMSLKKKVRPLTVDKYRLYQAVIGMTKKAYGLTPPQTSFPNNFMLNHLAGWNPRFSEKEKYDKKLRRWRVRTDAEIEADVEERAQTPVVVNGKQILMGAMAAVTRRNGRISIFANAFAAPDTLAALIFHETVHWIDTMKKSGRRRNLYARFQTEANAYTRQAAFLAQLNRPEAAAARAIGRQYSKQAKAISKTPDVDWPTVRMRHPTWLAPGVEGAHLAEPEPGAQGSAWEDIERAKASAEKDFYDNVARLREVSRKVREEAEKGGRRLDEKARRRDEVLRRIWEERDLQWKRNWEYLRTAVGLACSNPEAFMEQVRRGTLLDVGIETIRLSIAIEANSGGPGSLNSCQKHVLKKVAWDRNPVRDSTVLAWAIEYRDAHPTLLRRFTTSLGEFFESIAGMFEGGEGKDGESGDGYASPDRGRPRDDDSRIGELGGLPWDQARGIDAGAIGFD